MTSKTSLLASAALSIACALSVADAAQAAPKHRHRVAPASSRLANEVKALRAQVDTLQAMVQSQAQAQQQTQAQVQASEASAAEATAAARAAQAKLDMQIQQIPGAVQTAVAAQPPPTLDKLKYKGISLALGGFAEAAGIYRSKTIGSDIYSSFSRIPFDNLPTSRIAEYRGTARQSRLSFLAQGDINSVTHAAFYGEFDFLGAAQTANSIESNSYTPRIRNLYASLDRDDWGLHLLVGQSWSLATMNSQGITQRNELPPPTIDSQYIPGFVWARQPQVRITKDFADKQLWVALSLENPQTSFGGSAGNQLPFGVTVLDLVSGNATINPPPVGLVVSSGFNTVNTMSLNHVPDVIAKIAWEPNIGGSRPLHMEVFGIYRDFYDQITFLPGNVLGLPPGVRETNTSGGGGGFGVTYAAIPKVLDLQASGMVGKGIGRYASGQLPDATLRADGKVAPITETMFLLGATWHATPQLDVYLFGGQEREGTELSTFRGLDYGFGNLTNTPFTKIGCTTVGGLCPAVPRQVGQITAGLWDKAYSGSFGYIRLGLQYSHTQVDGFPGGGYTPKTSDDMVFTSFRYFPF